MNVLQDKLDFLLEKYSVSAVCGLRVESPYSVEADFGDGAGYIRLLPQRFERRFAELRSIASDGTLGEISAFRSLVMLPRGESLESAVRRELDICRFITEREVVSLAAFAAGGGTANAEAVNIIARLDGGAVLTIEAAASLPAGSRRIDKHELISARGVACDRTVDTQVPQDSIYLFTGEGAVYTDVDFELYGLEAAEAAAVRAAFALARDVSLRSDTARQNAALDRACAAYRQALAGGRKVLVG